MKVLSFQTPNWIDFIFNILFISYIALGLGFFGFRGYTWIPQLIGVFLAIAFFAHFIYTKGGLVIDISTKIFLSFLVYISISIILFFPQHYLYVTSIGQMAILYIVTVNLVGKHGKVLPFFIGIVGACIILIGNRIATFSPDEISRYMVRVGSTAGNQNDYGFILASSVNVLYLGKLYLQEKKVKNALYQILLSVFILIVSAECIVFSGSRTGTVIVIFSSLAFFIYKFILARPLSKIMYAASAVTIGMIAFTYAKSLPIYYRFLSLMSMIQGTSGRDYSSDRRFELIEIGIYRWLQKPFFGHGTGQLRYVNLDGTYAHNNFAEILANNGIVGFLIFYSMHIVISIIAFRIFFAGTAKYVWFFGVMIIALLLADFGMVNYYNKVYYLILALMAGLLLNEKRNQKQCVES